MTEKKPRGEHTETEPTRDAAHQAGADSCCGGGGAGEAAKSARARIEDRLDDLDRQFTQFKRDAIHFVLERTDPDVAEHMGNSGREFLLAMRTFIDKEIGHIDKSVKKCRDIHDDRQATREKEKAGAAN